MSCFARFAPRCAMRRFDSCTTCERAFLASFPHGRHVSMLSWRWSRKLLDHESIDASLTWESGLEEHIAGSHIRQFSGLSCGRMCSTRLGSCQGATSMPTGARLGRHRLHLPRPRQPLRPEEAAQPRPPALPPWPHETTTAGLRGANRGAYPPLRWCSSQRPLGP